MKKYLLGIVLFGLLGIWAVMPVSYASAKQQDITVENGAYSWGAESGLQVSALNYFVGDILVEKAILFLVDIKGDCADMPLL